jgi:hypothetical protein
LDVCPGTAAQQEKVKGVIKEWEKYANIKFEWVASQDATIRIILDRNRGSWSLIGCNIEKCEPPNPTMNLGWIDDTEVVSEIDRGVILHEFGHTLGLIHEHQSPMRGGIFRLNVAGTSTRTMSGSLSLMFITATIEYYTKHERWAVSDVWQNILHVYNREELSNYSRLDPKSIMMCVLFLLMPADL